jgi:hypothetical protein
MFTEVYFMMTLVEMHKVNVWTSMRRMKVVYLSEKGEMKDISGMLVVGI